MCISANFCCSYLRYYFLCLSYHGLLRGRRAKRLMATGLCHGGWGAAIISHPRRQRSKPRPCLLLCGLRCGRGFAFAACLGVPWQGQQNFTIAMQSFSVTRYRFERQDIPLNIHDSNSLFTHCLRRNRRESLTPHKHFIPL